VETHQGDDRPEVPRPTLWPVGFAIGVVCLLIGLVVSWPAVAVGGALAVLFGALWARDLAAGRHAPAAAVAELPAEPEAPATEGFPRSKFLEGATLGLGAVIGGAITVPVAGFAIIPPFLKQGKKGVDVGPLSDYPENEWKIVHFNLDPKEGDVFRRVAYVRYNGIVKDPRTGKSEPSFTIIANRCAHLGCPVQPNGLVQTDKTKDENKGAVQLTPVLGLSGFGCPCHGGAYDTEGNRTAGPPVRGLDRFQFSIRRQRLYIEKNYSVKTVSGTGGDARIDAFDLAGPGQHVGDWEAWLYPLQPPN
jgi:Rieske Fe-S protein